LHSGRPSTFESAPASSSLPMPANMAAMEALLRTLELSSGLHPVEHHRVSASGPPPRGPADLDAIEELMVLEVMRRSMLETVGGGGASSEPSASSFPPESMPYVSSATTPTSRQSGLSSLVGLDMEVPSWRRASTDSTDSSKGSSDEGRLVGPTVSPLRAARDIAHAPPVAASAPAPAPASAPYAAVSSAMASSRDLPDDDDELFMLALQMSLEPHVVHPSVQPSAASGGVPAVSSPSAIVFSPILSSHVAPTQAVSPMDLSTRHTNPASSSSSSEDGTAATASRGRKH
jgi:hypothetical protein